MFGASGATLAALCQKLRIIALCREAYTLDNTVDDAVTQNACHGVNRGKPNLDMRSRYMGKCRLTAERFYPELAEAGKRLRDAAAKQPRHPVASHCYLI